MNYTVTLAAAGTFDILPGPGRIAALVVENTGAGDAYYGRRPKHTATSKLLGRAPETTPMSATEFHVDAGCGVNVRQGMVPGDHIAFLAGTYVTGVRQFGSSYLVEVNIGLDVDITQNDTFSFTEPAVNNSTGITLASGQIERFTAAWGNEFLQQGLRVYSTAGCVLKIFTCEN